MSYCEGCGHELADDAKFCGGCGSRRGAVPTCTTCGLSLKLDAHFCPGCGRQVERDEHSFEVTLKESRSQTDFSTRSPSSYPSPPQVREGHRSGAALMLTGLVVGSLLALATGILLFHAKRVRDDANTEQAIGTGLSAQDPLDLLLTSADVGGLTGEPRSLDEDSLRSQLEASGDFDVHEFKMWRATTDEVTSDDERPPDLQGEEALDAYIEASSGGLDSCWADNAPKVIGSAGGTYGDTSLPADGPRVDSVVTIYENEEDADRSFQSLGDPDSLLVDNWRGEALTFSASGGYTELSCGDRESSELVPCPGFDDCLSRPDPGQRMEWTYLRRGQVLITVAWSDDAPVQGDSLIQKAIERVD